MAFTVICPGCDHRNRVAEHQVDTVGHCAGCGGELSLIPSTQTEVPADISPFADDPAFTAPSSPGNANPTGIGRYLFDVKLGEGGMGVVWRAHDRDLPGRPVALKIFHPSIQAKRYAFARFLREAQVAAWLKHAGLRQIFEVGNDAGTAFLVMEYLEGVTLSGRIEENRPWTQDKAADLVRAIALAMAHAHDQGFVHRHLQTRNIWIRTNGQPVVMDFGVARLYEGDDDQIEAEDFYGKLNSLSPEQVRGNDLDHRSDIYGLGTILYELITGSIPFRGESVEVMLKILGEEPEHPSKLNPLADEGLSRLCLKALAKRPEERPASMREFAKALSASVSVTPPVAMGCEAPTVLVLPSRVTSEGFLVNSIGMKFALLRDGEFRMGSRFFEPKATRVEKPQHSVWITRSFYLGVYPVTQAEFEAVMGVNPSYFRSTGLGDRKVVGIDTSRHPVEQVSWFDAVEFCNNLSRREGLRPCHEPWGERRGDGNGYRLPTEAEWEYACRAGSATSYSFGERLTSSQANYQGGSSPDLGSGTGVCLGRTSEVGSYPPNEFGLYDMHGKVFEWCSDWYSPKEYRKRRRLATNPPGPEAATERIIRGGGFHTDPSHCRSACRSGRPPEFRYFSLGFRVVRVSSTD
jgi:formylglycine-generating enzyme required for sulfatase activity